MFGTFNEENSSTMHWLSANRGISIFYSLITDAINKVFLIDRIPIISKTCIALLKIFLNVAQLSRLQDKSATGSPVFSADNITLVRSIQEWIKQLVLILIFT